ncbi:MAG: YdcF family protein [Anaerolineae bacterium]|jgi:uncharacterized SAM-binding protein YcdF (DUF218 family)|nr:YdcF family protein [Anaerolineae bacterium]
MFYVLSKLLPLFVYPTGLVCVLLIAAVILRHRPRASAGITVVALLILGLGANRLVSMTLTRALEWRIPPLTEATRPSADALIVLGGGLRQQLAPRPSHEVGEAGDRVLYAARLYHAGVAPALIVSGGEGPLQNPGTVSEAEAMAEMLVTLGVPRDAIVLEDTARNTYENALESAELLGFRGWTRVVLVTSAMHMPRAYAAFTHQNLEVIAAPTDYLLTYSDWDFYTQRDPGVMLMNLLPKAEYLEITERAMKEIIGIFVYHLRGWL